ncbi:alanine symporter family domain protein [Anaplasma phagocytophilum str. ApNYW]|nr:alanine symporter family domain protein [Anaplasma phagocytophilum str. ApNYW]
MDGIHNNTHINHKYATCYISIRTREERNGRTFGGPVVYSQHAFKTKWASLAVAIITMVCAVTVGTWFK